MTLSEYIEKREQVLKYHLKMVMEQDVINAMAVSIIYAQLTELRMISIALEDEKIEGI